MPPLQWTGPVYLRFGRDQYPVVPADSRRLRRSAKRRLLRPGNDFTMVTTGIMVSEGLQAAETLAARASRFASSTCRR